MITKVPMLCVIRVTIFHEWRPGWALVITHNMRKKTQYGLHILFK
jgi:hypothetical protein